MVFREDGRGLKQVFHEKPFKKLFLGVSRVASESRDESRELLDELASRVL